MNGGGAMVGAQDSSGCQVISMNNLDIAHRSAMPTGVQDERGGASHTEIPPSRKSVLNGLSELLLRRSSTKVWEDCVLVPGAIVPASSHVPLSLLISVPSFFVLD